MSKPQIYLDDIEDESERRLLERAAESDAMTTKVDGEEAEIVKSATADDEIKKAVDRTKSRKPDDPARDRVTAIAAAYEKDITAVYDLAKATVIVHLEKLAVEDAIRFGGDRVVPASATTMQYG